MAFYVKVIFEALAHIPLIKDSKKNDRILILQNFENKNHLKIMF